MNGPSKIIFPSTLETFNQFLNSKEADKNRTLRFENATHSHLCNITLVCTTEVAKMSPGVKRSPVYPQNSPTRTCSPVQEGPILPVFTCITMLLQQRVNQRGFTTPYRNYSLFFLAVK